MWYKNNNKPLANPFHLPDFSLMTKALTQFVKINQGEKGYIKTENEQNDAIWVLLWQYYDNIYEEQQIKAIRVKEGSLQILYDPFSVHYSDDDIANAPENDWRTVIYDDYILSSQTLLNIAESIEDYV